MRTKACIFDLDGVIVDTAKYHYLTWKRLADDLGIPFNEKDYEQLKGVSRMDSLEIILKIGKRKIDVKTKFEYASLKNRWYNDYIKRMTPDEVLPGCLDFITELKKADILVAIGSASKNAQLILERVNLNKAFDAVVDGNLVHRAKPDPEVFLTAAEMLRINTSNCMVFEDAAAGIQAALNAGMLCVGIGSEKILCDAHAVVQGLNEMSLEIISQIEKKSGRE